LRSKPFHALPMTPRVALVAPALLLAACHGSTPPAAFPTEFSLSRFRQPAETLLLAPQDQEAIYQAVLRFFRPAGNHVRWLDLKMLRPTPDTAEPALGRGLALRLLDRLGPGRACLQDAPAPCTGRSGGILRVSSVYGLTEERARVVVRFQSVPGPYAPETAFSVTEVFLVEKASRHWRLRTHAPASS
jgi:hypothetical protein